MCGISDFPAKKLNKKPQPRQDCGSSCLDWDDYDIVQNSSLIIQICQHIRLNPILDIRNIGLDKILSRDVFIELYIAV